MSKQRISGGSFDFAIDGNDFRAQKFSIDITDDSKATTKDGRPNGYILGAVSASGNITVDYDEFAKFKEMASSAKSWQAIKPFDFVAYANTNDEEHKIEIYGVKLKLNKILDADKTSADQTLIELPFEVTSPDFIKIDNIPYIAPKE